MNLPEMPLIAGFLKQHRGSSASRRVSGKLRSLLFKKSERENQKMPRFCIGDLGSDSVGKNSMANLQGTVGGEKGRTDHRHICPFNAHK